MDASEASSEQLPTTEFILSPPPAPGSSIPSPSTSSPPASVHSHQSSHHPILESQTEYYNQNFALAVSNPETPQDMSYSTPSSDYSYQAAGTPQQTISHAEVAQMLQSLRSRRVNTLTELRRIERILTVLPGFMSEYIGPMQDAWNNYVNSNNFLNELRGMTRQYPFSAELLEEAKQRVLNDANSMRSWNFAWLLLYKMRNDQIISEYATRTAHQPAMWGGYVPDQANAIDLANVLNREWNKAVDVMLRHWPVHPTY